ncbi:glutathione S-transferase family protein [Jiella sonneratiae]|uniref:Glutathione S-transferase family protein n=1 Tax=Jiella sonneratiae TaxID=2816856 RepID=A0ABS3J6L2_9HYPH|nr:glutathione S-transferase family protein [Jiella sonneratiae]MBO0905308.1 glutathione S-transferase family protein [Jiella sonneratiae]
MAITLYELVGRDTARPFSPHCWKARMALRHKGLDFSTATAGFTEIPEIEGGVSKIVPILRDGERLVADSFAIAEYLEETYPDRPSLFRGEGGRALSRFVESWSQRTIHPAIARFAVLDIHDGLAEADQLYFRQSREKALGTTLEAFVADRADRVEPLLASLEPLRAIVSKQAFLGGESPLFADYIVFGALQWARIASPFRFLPKGDPVTAWFERCLALHDGEGARVPAAA